MTYRHEDQSASVIESQILLETQKFLQESGVRQVGRTLSLDAELDSELGMGSLERAELFSRLERAFGVRFSDALMVEAKQLRDVIPAIQLAAEPKSLNPKPQHVNPLDLPHADPSDAETLIDVLQCYAESEPNRIHIYLQEEGGKETIIRYGELYAMARCIAQGLITTGLRPTETVAMMLPTTMEFFSVFFGILLAGGVPVPIYPPMRPDQIEAYAQRESLVLRHAGVRFLVTFQEAKGLSQLLQAFIPSLLGVVTAASLSREVTHLPIFERHAEDFALIQYTSGSTGNPKGVLLNHRNLLANIHAYGEAIGLKANDVLVSWLPLYHDMGLIGAWLGSLYYGVPLTLMTPLSFLSRPERWLWAIHYHRGTLSAGPNFAYELCLKKIEDSAIEGLDLSSWRLAFNGAEMIYPKTLRRFTKRFKAYGFRETAFLPVYGLAESTLALTVPKLNRRFKVDRIQRDPFECSQKAMAADAHQKKIYEFVSCGVPLDRHRVRIFRQGQVLGERMVGQVQFQGPSAMQGYYCNPDATQAVYHEGWWGSGDLGYLAGGELYITGREKDLIIKAGRNYYPAEIEEVINLCPEIRKGCVVAFGTKDEHTGTEKLLIVAETRKLDHAAQSQLRQSITEKVMAQVGLAPDEIFLTSATGVIPKTSSGKLRRADAKKAYLSGQLWRRGLPVTLQIMKLLVRGAWERAKSVALRIGKSVFTAYMGLVIVLTLLPVWGIMAWMPRRGAQICLHHWARWIFRLGFTPMTVNWCGHPTLKKKKIMVVNHTSYIDVLILLALFREPMSFIGKKELLRAPLLRKFIKYLDFIPIDRDNLLNSEADIKHIEASFDRVSTIVIFPEGTFSYATGIRPFKSGAFKIAVETQSAVIPIAIRGARSLLRGNTWLLRPSHITLTVCEPLIAQHKNWKEVVRLRERSRELITQHSGEKPINFIFSTTIQE